MIYKIPELSIIPLLIRDKGLYEENIKYISINKDNKELTNIYKTMALLLRERDSSSVDELESFFFSQYPTLKPEQIEAYSNIFNTVKSQEISDEMLTSLVMAIKSRQKALEIGMLAFDVSEGKKAPDELKSLLESFNEATQPTEDVSNELFTGSFKSIMEDRDTHPGLNWRLHILQKMLGPLRKGNFIKVFARPECLHPETKIMLTSGELVCAKDVEIGMGIMGDDSTPRYVMSTTSGSQNMYEIIYPWGESYKVNENHILSLKRSKVEGIHKYGDVLNVTVKEYLTWPEGRKARYKGWKTGVSFPSQSIPLDPYFIGLWLGDGTSANQQITSMDEEVIDWLEGYCQALKLTFYKASRKSQGKAFTLSLVNRKGYPNPVREHLKSLNLINNKHIPKKYLLNTEEVRKEVLAGLIDTDGYYDKRSNGYEIATVSNTLADDIVFLCRSLGLHATKNIRPNHYRIGIYGNLTNFPIRIKYKQQVLKDFSKRKGLHFGFSIKSLGLGEYNGFTLTGNHLFVLGDFTVTHNTGKTTLLASEITHMAEQLSEESPCLWFNNEEEGSKVWLRIMQGSMGVTKHDFETRTEELDLEFERILGRKIFLVDDGLLSKAKVERICKAVNPGLIVFDQIGKITGFDADREDLHQGKIYQWGRALAKQYCPVVAVGQADGTGEGVKWLTMSHIANAKTAIQAECDAILGLGKSHKEGEEYVRYLHLSKNKLDPEEESMRHGKQAVLILPEIARYRDV